MRESPAFQMYASDFYVDTAGWTAAQVGAYLRLLLHQWVEGPLENKMSFLARIAGVDVRNMQKMWSAVIAKKFTTDDANMLYNIRLENTRQELINYRESQRERGLKGADARWHKPMAPPLLEQCPNDGSSSSSSSSLKELEVSNDTSLSSKVSEDEKIADEKVDNCPHTKIVALYHKYLPANPKIKQWTNGRAGPLRARWREHKGRQNLEYWHKFFLYVSKSKFLTGQKAGKNGPFTPGLEWMVKAENFAKIIEGRYHKEFMTERDKDYDEAKRISEVLRRIKDE